MNQPRQAVCPYARSLCTARERGLRGGEIVIRRVFKGSVSWGRQGHRQARLVFSWVSTVVALHHCTSHTGVHAVVGVAPADSALH